MSFKGMLTKEGIIPRSDGQLEFRKPVNFVSGLNATIGRGKVFYVDSVHGANTNSGKTPYTAFATLDYAVGKCRANMGDIIYLLPKHAETLVSATSCVIDVAGVSVIGLGQGEDKPLFTCSTAAAAKISITAASVRLENIRMLSAYTGGITTGISLSAAAGGAILRDIEMRETANTKEWLIGVSIADGCSYVTIDGFKYFGIAGGTTSQVIKFVGISNNSVVRDFLIYVDASGAAIDALTKASSWMTIENGVIHNLDTSAGLTVSVKSDTTGFMHDLRLSGLFEGALPAGAAMAISEVYSSNVIFKQGFYGIAQDS